MKKANSAEDIDFRFIVLEKIKSARVKIFSDI